METMNIRLFVSKVKLEPHENICKNHDYCYEEMPEKAKSLQKCNHGGKYIKVLFIIFAVAESLFGKIDKVITLTNEDTITQTKRFSYIQNKNLLLILTMKKYHKLQNHCHYTGKYEYHLIIKKLAKKF